MLCLEIFQRSATQFKRRSCYEIGDDVFSLSELESLVIRGKTRRPSRISLPFVAPPKKSMAYIIYALDATDYRINFVLVSAGLVPIAMRFFAFTIRLPYLPFADTTLILLFFRTMAIRTTQHKFLCLLNKLWTIKSMLRVKISF